MENEKKIEIEKKEPHSQWLARSQIIDRLLQLEERMEIWKRIEDFFKVERITIIESRLDALENLHKFQSLEVELEDDVNEELELVYDVPYVPSVTTVPPLPEDVDVIITTEDMKIQLTEINPNPAGVFIVGNDLVNEVEIAGKIEPEVLIPLEFGDKTTEVYQSKKSEQDAWDEVRALEKQIAEIKAARGIKE